MIRREHDLHETTQWVAFRLDGGRYALPLASVERIVRAVYVTPLPRAPGVVMGAIDVAGRVLPVFNIRRRFGLPERAVDPSDHFVIAQTSTRTVVLAVDAAHEVVVDRGSVATRAAGIVRDLEHISGVIQLDDGLVLIHDLERFLAPDEARALDAAMSHEARHVG